MGAWIEILGTALFFLMLASRTPRWVRGLKSISSHSLLTPSRSHPTMGAWIEIEDHTSQRWHQERSHPTMGAWIEIWLSILITLANWCRTPRWVRGLKFWFCLKCCLMAHVAPHDGCVDWNIASLSHIFSSSCRTPRWVRGLKSTTIHLSQLAWASHPTMGAWIEI